MNLLDNTRFLKLNTEEKALLFILYLKCRELGFCELDYTELSVILWGESHKERWRETSSMVELLEAHGLLLTESRHCAIPDLAPDRPVEAIEALCNAPCRSLAKELLPGLLDRLEWDQEPLDETLDLAYEIIETAPSLERVAPLPEQQSIFKVEDDRFFIQTKTGKWYPKDKQIAEWQKLFPDTDIQGVLDELKLKVEAGAYPYTRQGMNKAAARWVANDATQYHKHTKTPKQSHQYQKDEELGW